MPTCPVGARARSCRPRCSSPSRARRSSAARRAGPRRRARAARRRRAPLPPLRARTTLPFGPPKPPPLERALRVIVGGDILPHRPSLIAPAAIRAALAPLGPLFAKADTVVANYEAATGDVDPKAFRLAYAAPRGWLEELPKAGLRAVTVANNHACDLGEPGLDATLEAAQKSGLVALGADASDPWAPRAIVEQGGKRICAVAWTTLSNSEGACSKSRHLAVAPLSVARQAAHRSRVREGADPVRRDDRDLPRRLRVRPADDPRDGPGGARGRSRRRCRGHPPSAHRVAGRASIRRRTAAASRSSRRSATSSRTRASRGSRRCSPS